MNEYGFIIPIALAVAAFLVFHFHKKWKRRRRIEAETPWITRHSRGVPKSPVFDSDGRFHVEIPGPGGTLGTLVWVDQPDIQIGDTITLEYAVDGGPIVQTEDPTGPLAAAGVMLQRRGDTLSGRGRYAGYRWYHRDMLPLTEGTHTVTLQVDPAVWGPVMSDPQADSFEECLRDLDALNIVFGGTSGRAHGAYTPAPPAVFALLDIRINRGA